MGLYTKSKIILKPGKDYALDVYIMSKSQKVYKKTTKHFLYTKMQHL